MFDFDATKILIVGAVALVFIPPKDLPRVMRQAGQFVGKMKRMASEFQGQFMDAMREADMADLRKEAQQLSQSTRVELGLDQLNSRMRQTLESSATPSTKVVVHDMPGGSRPPLVEAVAGVGLEPSFGQQPETLPKVEPVSQPAAHSA